MSNDITDLNRECIAFLKERRISLETAAKCGIRRGRLRGTDAIAFPYYVEDTITGYKLRSITIPKREGGFSIVGKIGGLFLSHLVDPSVNQLVICEGEFDPLACYEAGVLNAVSLPHGAIHSANSVDSTKLACLSEAAGVFKNIKRIVIATDGDGPGKATGDEIARRVGRWRAYRVAWPNMPKPDANEVLMKLGASTLSNIISDAAPEDIPGLARPEKYKADLLRFREGEILKGETTGYEELDEIYRIAPVFTTVTGYPGSGKTRFVAQLQMNLAMRRGAKFATWSRESPGFIQTADMIEMFVKKRFHKSMNNVMSDEEMEEGFQFVNQHCTMLESGDEPDTMESILERGTAAVLRDGIESLGIDPYNYITKNGEAREDLQISEMLGLGTDWTKNYGCGIFFIAHPKTVNPDIVPVGNHISGGSTFHAKTDFGLTVYREDMWVKIRNWKTKHAWLGKLGDAELGFDMNTGCYYDPGLLATEPARYTARYIPPVPAPYSEPRYANEDEL